MSGAERGFPQAEFESRIARAQAMMQAQGLSALLLTTEPEVRYYTGFLTRFWESPTRPWFLVLPAQAAPIAVIPTIGEALMARTGLRDIRCWPAPDYADEGMGLLAETLAEVTPRAARIGLADGRESHVRMPLASLAALRERLSPRVLASDGGITEKLRRVKSEAEVAKIASAAGIANRAFARLGEIAAEGVRLDEVFRRFQMLCLEEGADCVPYLAGAAAAGGYSDVISPATDAPLQRGDVLMLDTGLVRDGYFCDFDRNASLGPPGPETASAHARLIDATQVAVDAARPGARMSDLYGVMARSLGLEGNVGRLGHGVGMQLTEGPSIVPQDHTELVPGMVLAIEPLVQLPGGRTMVHEENIVVREGAADYLSAPQGSQMLVLS